MIWIQWVLGHLSDRSLVAFLQRCARALTPSGGGVVVVKENVTTLSGAGAAADEAEVLEAVESTFDAQDSSFTRPRHSLVAAFHAAGFELIAERAQTNFPPAIYPVRMFALRPVATPSSSS